MRGIGLGTERVENCFLFFTGRQKVGVPALIQHGQGKGEAVRGRSLDGDGVHPFFLFIERRGAREQRGGVSFGTDAEQRNVESRNTIGEKLSEIGVVRGRGGLRRGQIGRRRVHVCGRNGDVGQQRFAGHSC